jgi:hypothetical protein
MASSSQNTSAQVTTAAHSNSYDEWNHAGTWEEDYDGHDAYDDYGDFGLGGYGGGGGGAGRQKNVKRQAQRGGGGSGTIYSARHIRGLEARRQSQPRTKAALTQKK